MTIDIIIPCIKDDHLKDCLDSIAAQAFKDVNIIIERDDKSNPLGVAAMRNRGLDKACSDYVLFVDSDDYLGREALTKAAASASQNPGKLVRIGRKRCSWRYSTTLAIEDGKTSGIEDSGESFGDAFYDTVLGQLIPRELIGDMRFEESLRYYSDLPFMAGLYEKAGIAVVPDAIYYKRLRNDPGKDPSLDQEINPERFVMFARAVRLSAAAMSDPSAVWDYMCRFLVSRTVTGRMPKALKWSDKDISTFSGLVNEAPRSVTDSFRGEERRILRAFKGGNIQKIRRMVRGHAHRLMWRDRLKSAHRRKLLIYHRIFQKLPVRKDVVLFTSFFGRAYCDSPRAIYEYMRGKYPDRKYVWVINNGKTSIPGKPARVAHGSLGYYYWLAVAGKYVSNVRQPEWYIKRDGTTFLQTWHGTPLKRLACDLEDVFAARPADYKREFCRQAAEWDCLISDNAFSSDAFSTAFRYPKEKMAEIGYPRNDILYAPDIRQRAEEIKKKLSLPLDRKIVLYAPTWRDDEVYADGGRFTLKLDFGMMKELSDRYHFILRTHYLISENLKLTDGEKRYVTDLSSYDDIAELYLAADVLITDYSSVFFDYANLGRPILFYVYDMEKYRDELHGFYFDMKNECPGPLLYDSAQVAEALASIEDIKSEYADKYKAFREKFCCLDDGGAAARAAELLN